MPVRPLSPELAEKARLELNEDPKRLESDIQHLKDWIAKQPHLKARTEDQWLVTFLRGCKFSLEKAKQKLDLYYTLQTMAPAFFNTLPSDQLMNEFLDIGSMVYLPTPLTPTAPVLSIFRMGVYDPKKYTITDLCSCSSAIQKILLMENDNAVVAGFQTIMDMENSTMAHFFQMTPMQMKMMTLFIQDAAPIRFKGSHYLNTIPGFETFFNVTKTFLNEKNRSRLFVHNKNYEEMYKHIPKEVLPAEYGGNGGTLKEISEYWKKKFQEYKPWLEEDLKYGTDERKRPGKPKTAEELFGVDGSFRQLEFD